MRIHKIERTTYRLGSKIGLPRSLTLTGQTVLGGGPGPRSWPSQGPWSFSSQFGGFLGYFDAFLGCSADFLGIFGTLQHNCMAQQIAFKLFEFAAVSLLLLGQLYLMIVSRWGAKS